MSENRADSAHIQTGLVQEAFKDIKPPSSVVLEPKHMPFWYAIIQARHQWTEIDLFHAANLARCFCAIEEETALLSMEGSIVYVGKRGDVPSENPRSRRVFTLTNQATNLSQKLQVHAQATMGNPRDNVKKNTKKQEMLEAFEDDDDLIAKPVN